MSSNQWILPCQDVSDPVVDLSLPATAQIAKFAGVGGNKYIVWDSIAFVSANYDALPVGTVVHTYLAGAASVSIKESDSTWTTIT